MMHRIQNDWYSQVEIIQSGSAAAAEKARQDLRESLLSIAPLFDETPFFMSEEFSLVDCYLAPLLWRLPTLGFELTGQGSKEIKDYMTRVFERDSFQASLTDIEREIHE